MTADEDLSSLWRSAPHVEVSVPSSEALRMRSATIARAASIRTWGETFGGTLGIVAVAALGLWASSYPLLRIGCALLVLGESVVIATLLRRGRARPAPALAAPTEEHLAHLRRELARERDLLAAAWTAYFAPMVPGLVLVPVALLLAIAPFVPPLWMWLNLVVFVVVTVAIVAFLAHRSRRRAERLTRELEGLDAGRGE